MANWKKWLNDGLLQTVIQNQTEIKRVATEIVEQGTVLGKQALDESHKKIQTLYQESGLQSSPDPTTQPLAALHFELLQVMSCLLQTPKSESYYLAAELTDAVSNRLLSQHKIGAMLSLARSLGNPSTVQNHSQFASMAAQNASLSSLARLLGGGFLSRILVTGGLGMIAGQSAYQSAAQHARQYEQLNDLERQLIDQISLLIRSIEVLLPMPDYEELADYQTLKLARDELNQSLQQHQQQLCEPLQAEQARLLTQQIAAQLTHLP